MEKYNASAAENACERVERTIGARAAEVAVPPTDVDAALRGGHLLRVCRRPRAPARAAFPCRGDTESSRPPLPAVGIALRSLKIVNAIRVKKQDHATPQDKYDH